MSERLDLGFTLTAQNTQGGTTQNYGGAYAKLAVGSVASFGLGARSGVTDVSARIDTSLGAAGSWAAGVAILTVSTAISRLATPDGPYTALNFGIAPNDSDGVQMNALDLDIDNNGTNDHKALGVSTDARFGRLRLANAYGPGTIDLPVDLRAEYYSGTAFDTNVDDNCTAFVPNNFLLTYVAGSSITSANLPAGNITISGSLAAGMANLRLTKPSGALANPGGATLCLDLDAGAGGDVTCAAPNPAAKAYLQGPWGVPTYDRDPKASLGFGLFGSQPRNFIFFRENY